MGTQALSQSNFGFVVTPMGYCEEMRAFIMERMKGTLMKACAWRRVLHDGALVRKPPTLVAIVSWLTQSAQAVRHLHEDLKIVHRDIKPENILEAVDGGVFELVCVGSLSCAVITFFRREDEAM